MMAGQRCKGTLSCSSFQDGIVLSVRFSQIDMVMPSLSRHLGSLRWLVVESIQKRVLEIQLAPVFECSPILAIGSGLKLKEFRVAPIEGN